jgi:receptor-type tyrosine-protein phosphatase gamma
LHLAGPNGDYKIWVKAFTYKNEGDPSIPVDCRTDIAGPGPPKIVNLTCITEDSLIVQWLRPVKFYKSIDYYYLMFRSEDSFEFNENIYNATSEIPKGTVRYFIYIPLPDLII